MGSLVDARATPYTNVDVEAIRSGASSLRSAAGEVRTRSRYGRWPARVEEVCRIAIVRSSAVGVTIEISGLGVTVIDVQTEMSSFEDILSGVLSELIAVSLEYASPSVSDVYVYGSIENGTVQWEPFFLVDGRVVERHNLPGVNSSGPRQKSLLQYGAGQLQRLRSAGEAFASPVPTQLKLYYVVASGALDATYQYEAQYSEDPTLTTGDLVDQWQTEVQNQLGQP